ncbi:MULTISPECIES: DUF1697 domain-containing protein [Streptomyces]|uniref:DUF1697 domain-containing protein n=1 Tax=Streptomyces TaxID=1883 RepID=UPI000C26F955|nr:DUF1697 domain-containing protein [Streptomyces sp. CB01201]MBX7470992.1 DUF1697 domain-containing protein [Streptomyces sp. MAG02]PJM98050.1 hypothetical protein CG740_37835 [Streptomyces sp. CB01201]
MTTTYAALLRGINVGGKKKVPMAELRNILEELGHGQVRTYLNSGNAVFTSASRDPDALAAELAAAIEERFGFEVACMVRTGPYLRSVLDACPFPAEELAGKQLHATFFAGPPVTAERFASIDASAYLPEEFRLGDQVLYLYAPDGLGTSQLAAALSRPGLLKGVDATSRNWNTVKALVEMTRAAGDAQAG